MHPRMLPVNVKNKVYCCTHSTQRGISSHRHTGAHLCFEVDALVKHMCMDTFTFVSKEFSRVSSQAEAEAESSRDMQRMYLTVFPATRQLERRTVAPVSKWTLLRLSRSESHTLIKANMAFSTVDGPQSHASCRLCCCDAGVRLRHPCLRRVRSGLSTLATTTARTRPCTCPLAP
jgi:hypothetical protein